MAKDYVGFRPGKYRELLDRSRDDGKSPTEVIHEALQDYYYGIGQLPADVRERLEALCRVTKRPLAEIVEQFLDWVDARLREETKGSH